MQAKTFTYFYLARSLTYIHHTAIQSPKCGGASESNQPDHPTIISCGTDSIVSDTSTVRSEPSKEKERPLTIS